MPRVRKGAARRRKHKKILKAARGFFGAGSRRYRIALDKVFRAGVSATRDRRLKKRNFRRLWITRITAACRQRGIRYSQFMFGLTESDIMLNRKMLSEIAIADPAAFDELVTIAQSEKAPPKKKVAKKAEKAEKTEPEAKATPDKSPVEAEAPAEEKKKPAKKAAKKATKKTDDAVEAKPEKKTAKKAAKKTAKKAEPDEDKPAKKKAVKKTVKKAAKKTAKKSEKKDD